MDQLVADATGGTAFLRHMRPIGAEVPNPGFRRSTPKGRFAALSRGAWFRLVLFVGLVLLAGRAGLSSAEEQSALFSPIASGVVGGQIVSVDVRYSTSTGAAGLSGIGLRLHWDSSALDLIGVRDVLEFGKIASDAVCRDDSATDYDADPATDCFVQIAWAHLDRAWPGTDPALLLSADFASRLADGETTSVRLSASSVTPGFDFARNTFAATGVLQADALLTVHVGGYGSVSSTPAGIECAARCVEQAGNCGTCAAEFAVGETVSLTATYAGLHPPVWSGCAPDASARTCVVELTESQEVGVEIELCNACLPSQTGWRLRVMTD